MCGITGIFNFNSNSRVDEHQVSKAAEKLLHRGPDNHGYFIHENVGLGHARLSIIDVSNNGHQPFTDTSGRYTMVYNGEAYNYQELRSSLVAEGIKFKSSSDTEVVLELYKKFGSSFVSKLNGFFALAIYDSIENQLFIARDRFGIKPLYYFSSPDFFAFSSELTSLLSYDIPNKLHQGGISHYLQLNYIPFEESAIEHVIKVPTGSMLRIQLNGQLEIKKYYNHQEKLKQTPLINDSFETAKEQVVSLLKASVQKRLIADVPVGCFLSGGVDSSVIAALAARENSSLQTFSIGFKDQPFLDESSHAELVAKHLGTQHETYQIQNDDLLQAYHSFLENIDEPFADSSALAVHYLCNKVSSRVKVALSGDGADELFSGYYKHAALTFSSTHKLAVKGLRTIKPLLNLFPKSRDKALPNLFRQLHKLAEISSMSPADKYWTLSHFHKKENVADLFLQKELFTANRPSNELESDDLRSYLFEDFNMVLEGDMLVKVDRMSMQHGLEVRTPFLDHQLVEYVFSLPDHYKMKGLQRKYILRSAFEDFLPSTILQRSKKGFEVPLRKWFLEDLKDDVENKWLSASFIKDQGIFDHQKVELLFLKLKSKNPEDVANQIWNLVVFNAWWSKLNHHA